MKDPAILPLVTCPQKMHTYFHWHLLEMFSATLFITISRNYPNVHARKDFKTVVYSHNLILQLHHDENKKPITNGNNMDEFHKRRVE